MTAAHRCTRLFGNLGDIRRYATVPTPTDMLPGASRFEGLTQTDEVLFQLRRPGYPEDSGWRYQEPLGLQRLPQRSLPESENRCRLRAGDRRQDSAVQTGDRATLRFLDRTSRVYGNR